MAPYKGKRVADGITYWGGESDNNVYGGTWEFKGEITDKDCWYVIVDETGKYKRKHGKGDPVEWTWRMKILRIDNGGLDYFLKHHQQLLWRIFPWGEPMEQPPPHNDFPRYYLGTIKNQVERFHDFHKRHHGHASIRPGHNSCWPDDTEAKSIWGTKRPPRPVAAFPGTFFGAVAAKDMPSQHGFGQATQKAIAYTLGGSATVHGGMVGHRTLLNEYTPVESELGRASFQITLKDTPTWEYKNTRISRHKGPVPEWSNKLDAYLGAGLQIIDDGMEMGSGPRIPGLSDWRIPPQDNPQKKAYWNNFYCEQMTNELNYRSSVKGRNGNQEKVRVILAKSCTGAIYVLSRISSLHTPPLIVARYMLGKMLDELVVGFKNKTIPMSKYDIAIQEAMFLDGGGSAQLYLDNHYAHGVNDSYGGALYHPSNNCILALPW